MTNFEIHCSAGDLWYIGFTDKKGVSRLLPAKKKLFGYWKTSNCPKTVTGPIKILIVSDGFEDITPDHALENFKKQYNSVEEYLGCLND